MTLRLNGSTSGYTEIDAPAVAGSNTLVLPGGNGTADQALVTNGSGTLSFADRGRMVLETAQTTTSGTSKDFTSIPSWVKKITVLFNGVSTNGTSIIQLQLGTSGGFTTSGYVSAGSGLSNVVATAISTTGFITSDNNLAANLQSGLVTIATSGSNGWQYYGGIYNQTSKMSVCSGGVTLSSTLTQLRITTVNGTDTFDAGSINLLLEG
jgi:hypothetical protein